MTPAPATKLATLILLVVGIWISDSEAKTQKLTVSEYEFGPFNSSYYNIFSVISPATISNEALQVTPDSAGNFTLVNRSGRVFFKNSFKLWEATNLASFNSSFLINIFRLTNSSHPGDGFAFLISPTLNLPPNSHGQYLGLTNSTTDGLPSNRIVAIELDTFKQDFDPDDNHIGLDINSVRSNKTVSLSDFGIQIAPVGVKFYMVWVQYDGANKFLEVYMAEQKQGPQGPIISRPSTPVLTADLDLSTLVNQNSYFGFAASTGSVTQLNCVLRWNLTVELLPGGNGNNQWLKMGLAVGIAVLVLLVIGIAGLGYYVHKKRAADDPNILGTLKSLPGTPREFSFRDLKKATNNFDDKHKLGQGGFGVVFKGVLPKENLEIAVKKFCRDNLKGKDDFLAELTIINRLRHKHLVRLQ
ncbi:probable L-type lectin-domain containing receptor kinase S.5, partial [Pistacia vera]|uniref:probable L-type lectin-domain containing receptor kinase S.5 n=1 Tax=Pistacia vera TaxID=55513 RepID=UPI001262F097